MCLAIPVKIVEILPNDEAMIELNNVTKKVNISLLENLKIGDWVIVHAGFTIERFSEKDALETLKLFEEMMAKGN